MSRTAQPDKIRDEIAKLEVANDRIALQLADLDARRDDAEGERRRNAARLAQLRSDLRAALDAPALERRAAAAVEALRGRLAAPPAYPGDATSPTRRDVGYDLDALEADARLEPAERLARAERLTRDFASRRTLDLDRFARSEIR